MNKGYTILILILVLMAIGLLIITTSNFLGVDKAKMSVNRYQSGLGFYLATACAEEAMELIRASGNPDRFEVKDTKILINFPGNINYYCWYSVEGQTPNKYVRSRSDLSNFPRQLEIKIVKIERPPSRKLTIGYWLEK